MDGTGNPEGTKRTTVLFRPIDLDNVARIADLFGGSVDVSTVLRRALQLTADVLGHQADGGQVVLQNGDRRECIRFM